jgi:hypothetical protein
MLSKPLTIEGRKIRHGDAVAIPNRKEPGVDGRLFLIEMVSSTDMKRIPVLVIYLTPMVSGPSMARVSKCL